MPAVLPDVGFVAQIQISRHFTKGANLRAVTFGSPARPLLVPDSPFSQILCYHPASLTTMAKETSSKLQSFPTQETMNLELVKGSPAPLPEAVTKLKTALRLKDQEIEILHRISEAV